MNFLAQRGIEIQLLTFHVGLANIPVPLLLRSLSRTAGRDGSPPQQVIKKLRCRCNARDKQTISRPCARDVQQVTLGVIDLLQIGVVAHSFDALLQGDDFIIAGHHDDGAELQPLGQMHGADRDVTAGGFDVFV